MSLYKCLDLIDDALLDLDNRRINAPQWWMRLRNLFSQDDKIFLDNLKQRLAGRIQLDNYDNLDKDIKFIHEYFFSQGNTHLRTCLKSF